MLILRDEEMENLETDWRALTDGIDRAVRAMDVGDFVQPLKPYLRYGDPRNRIIAMPAYLGGSFHIAGLKWIASFPGNRSHGLPRAHGVVVLNRADTGEPYALLIGGRLNQLRTAAVSGLVMRKYAEARPHRRPLRVSIIGWGPIGRAHLDMCDSLLGDGIGRFRLFDLAGIAPASIPGRLLAKTSIAADWPEAYLNCDVCITCTVADRRYIDIPPPAGNLLLHVSLRDYEASALRDIRAIFVDQWEEVCRENTDIELLHRTAGLQQEQTRTIADIICRDALLETGREESVLFCPMGMAIFDLATADCVLNGLGAK